MMDVFSIDSEVPFEEWEKTIRHHAFAYEPKGRDPVKLRDIAAKLLEKEKENERDGLYDVAYYYAIKCLQIFDKEKTGCDVRQSFPETRKYMAAALQAQQEIFADGLMRQYKAKINFMRSHEEERQSRVAQQMENDTAPAFSQNAHLTRQRQLLENEKDGVDKLRERLNQSRTPQASAPQSPAPASEQNTKTPLKKSPLNNTPSPAYPIPQYGGMSQNPEPSPYTTTYAADYAPQQLSNPVAPTRPRYESWQYNTAGAALTSARRGMVNLGNTCYMNSVCQAINTTPIADYFMGNEYQGYLVSTGGGYVKVANSFIYVVRELRRQGCAFAVSSSAFRGAVGEVYEPFQSFKQQDANEFLRVLLDSVHSALNENAMNKTKFAEIDTSKGTDEELSRVFWWQYSQKNTSIISRLCGFQEKSAVTCPSCGNSSRSFAASFGIEVQVCRKAKTSVEDCLAAYTAKEILGHDSLYTCERCKKKVRATKQLQFYSTPQVLFVTLKRFRTYGDFTNVEKVNDEVFFDRYLDLKPFMASDFSSTKFRLVGVVNHQGNMHGGHYTADALGSDGAWCNFSDERITQSTTPDFRLAYILCYSRID